MSFWARDARLERLEAALDELREAANEGIPLIVEGEKDEIALRNLQLSGPIIRINQGMPIFTLVEGLARQHDALILLTDWDRTGGHLARLLRDACQANGIKLDERHRKALSKAVGSGVNDIESLDTHLTTLRQAKADDAPWRVRGT